MSKTVRVCMISGDKFLDHAMRAFDVFEPFKRLAVPKFFTMTLNDNHASLEKLIDLWQTDAEKASLYVVAVFFVGTNIGWIDPTVKVVSDGEHFEDLQNLLLHCGYVPATESTPA